MTSFMSRLIRLLLVAAALLALAVVTLYLMGGRRAYESSLLIEAPDTFVFESLSDRQKPDVWGSSVVRVEPLTEGDAQVGSKVKITVRYGSTTVEAVDEIVEFDPQRRLQTSATSRLANVRTDFRLEASAKRTHVTLSVLVFPKGLLRLLILFRGRQIEQQLAEQLQRLKRTAEENYRQSPEGTER